MLSRVKEMRDGLSRAERQVADAILANPALVIESPLASLAAQAGTSEPTVVRFCRSLGCRGFREFKLRLAKELARTADLVHVDVDAADSAPALIAKITANAIRGLQRVRDTLDAASIEGAIRQIVRARRVEFWGLGASGLVALDAQNKFFRLGVGCVAYSDTPTLLQSAAILERGDCVVAISNSGETSLLIRACELATANGATVIAVTTPGSTLASRTALTLLVDVQEDTGVFTPRSSRLAHLAVLDVLQVGAALALGQKAVERLRKTKAVIPLTREVGAADTSRSI